MTRLENLKQRLSQAEAKRRMLIYSGQAAIPDNLVSHLKALEEEISLEEERLKNNGSKPLGKLFTREELCANKIPELIVKLHFAADFLDECAFNLRSALKKLGAVDCTLYPKVDEIHKAASDFASMVCEDRFTDLKDVMLNNSELIDELSEVLDRWLQENAFSKPSW